MRWVRKPWPGPAIRLAGAVSLCCSVAAASPLLAHAGVRGWAPGLLDYLLAAIAFVTASAGSAMLLMGAHLFDEVQLSERWARRPVPPVRHMRVAGEMRLSIGQEAGLPGKAGSAATEPAQACCVSGPHR